MRNIFILYSTTIKKSLDYKQNRRVKWIFGMQEKVIYAQFGLENLILMHLFGGQYHSSLVSAPKIVLLGPIFS
jgi:hypothetical protein